MLTCTILAWCGTSATTKGAPSKRSKLAVYDATKRASLHGVNIIYYECKEEGCEYKAKEAGKLRRHLAHMHAINVVWHKCDHKGCSIKAKKLVIYEDTKRTSINNRRLLIDNTVFFSSMIQSLLNLICSRYVPSPTNPPRNAQHPSSKLRLSFDLRVGRFPKPHIYRKGVLEASLVLSLCRSFFIVES